MSLSEMVDTLTAEGALDDIGPRELQRLIAAVVRQYSMLADSPGGYFPIVPDNAITATDAMIVSSALLKRVNIAVFELGLWQSWAGGVPQEVPA